MAHSDTLSRSVSPYTKATARAIAKYGVSACSKAYELNTRDGEGASTILHSYDCGFPFRTVGQVDAAINAGAELAAHRPDHSTCVHCGFYAMEHECNQ